jgi:tetratricopeptide (TPR) repeat protein
MKRRVLAGGVIAALIVLFAAGTALAQAGRGTARIGGVVLDPAGKPVPGAKVAAQFDKDNGSKFDTTTDKDGKWGIMGIGTGNWTITVTAKGFMPKSVGIYAKQLEKNPAITISLEKQKEGSGIIQDESAFQALEQGNQFFAEGKYDTAIIMYDEFMTKNPGAYQVLLNIGDCYREKGDFPKALEYYNKLLDQSKNDTAMGKTMGAKALAAIGLISLKQNKMDEATEYFKKSIEMAPQDEMLPYNVGEIYFSNQNIDEALRYYEMAIQIKPDWPDPYYRVALVYINKGDMAKASENLEKFIKLEPDTPRTEQAKAILGSIKK